MKNPAVDNSCCKQKISRTLPSPTCPAGRRQSHERKGKRWIKLPTCIRHDTYFFNLNALLLWSGYCFLQVVLDNIICVLCPTLVCGSYGRWAWQTNIWCLSWGLQQAIIFSWSFVYCKWIISWERLTVLISLGISVSADCWGPFAVGEWLAVLSKGPEIEIALKTLQPSLILALVRCMVIC